MPAVIETAHLSATRAGYDAMAEQYAEHFRAALDEAPLDRALLSGFAELVRRDHPDPQLLEIGSGPGNVAAYLHQLGMTVRGIDLSPAMVELARREHPGIKIGRAHV
jgi:2-polyprenyl-3-methyl-5-hydroxy-6-metoxy-1,4-benzoquinol methylase